MTNELIKLLSDLDELIKSWNDKKIANEEELRTELKPLNDKLTEELKTSG